MKDFKVFEKFSKKVDLFFEKKAVGEIIFSEGTYEVEVFDFEKQETFWPFLQIDDEQNLLDGFCVCDESDDENGCVHLACAYKRICNSKPLHIHFKNSLFNRIFQIQAKRHGLKKMVLKENSKKFEIISPTKKLLLQIYPKTKSGEEKLNEIIEKRIEETEETSLKFSKLSQEEISKYKEGKASFKLAYELSFWSDLARWFFFLFDEKKECKITFLEENVPNYIIIEFDDVYLKAYISLANLPLLIPTFKDVKSPLRVFDSEDQFIDRIDYDREKKCLRIIKKQDSVIPLEKKGQSIDGWIYERNVGFYLKCPSYLLKNEKICKKNISFVFDNYFSTISKFLKKENINLEEVAPQYLLYFDDDSNLHIKTYIENVGDLDETQAFYYDPWVFLPNRGFLKLKDAYFKNVETIIEKEQISDFVTNHRMWLHNFEGFRTNFGSIESQLTYKLTDKGLKFDISLDLSKDFEDAIDFDNWIYLKNRGFWAKKKSQYFSIGPDVFVENLEISKFIDKFKDELEQVNSFFTNICPIKQMGLNIFVDENEKIKVVPEIQFNENFNFKNVKFFGDYTFVEKMGFYHIPPNFRLPQNYQKENVITRFKEPYFINYELDKLKRFCIYIDSKLQKPKKLTLRVENIEREDKEDQISWICSFYYVSELGFENIFTIINALLENRKYAFTQSGLIYLKDSRFNWLKNIEKHAFLKRRRKIKLTSLEWIRLMLFEDVGPFKQDPKKEKKIKNAIDEIKKFHTERLMNLSLLKANLRSYQENGVKWLWFLYCHNLSGLLCDDMGLGKTHQAMGLISSIQKNNEKKINKYIVICPTSVIYHWQNLLNKFLPSLRVLAYHGFKRELEDFENSDILLTSYGICRLEMEVFKSFKFELAIFDELQFAKNKNSQIHKSLKFLNAKMKLGLTGTPIENRLKELKAIFDLVLPFYLPSDSYFYETFTIPIEKHADESKKRLLKKIIKPFILRRKKKDVLLELPEKIEEIAYCDLIDDQKQLYLDILKTQKQKFLSELKKEDQPVSYPHIFSFLSKLKQICDHPAIYYKNVKQYQKYASGKWDLFLELLSEAKESYQKVVIFSQYLDMIAIIENYLKRKKIGFAKIIGSTANRFHQISKFHEDEKCEVFLCSLLAGGVGIDLSCASVVIHYDRWWNSAKENQATDRVHRYGQKRGVQVFKLVTKNSIEERIHAIIERKQNLIDDMIEKDDQDQIKYLSRDELIAILETVSVE